MQNDDDVIELVDDGTGTFVPSGKVEKKRRKRKTEPANEVPLDFMSQMPPAFMQEMGPLMERQNFRGAHSPLDQLMDGMEIGTRAVNRFMHLLASLEKGMKVR